MHSNVALRSFFPKSKADRPEEYPKKGTDTSPIPGFSESEIVQLVKLFMASLIYDVFKLFSLITPSLLLIHVEVPFQNPLLEMIWLPGRLRHFFDGLLGGGDTRCFAVISQGSCWCSRS